MKIREYKEADRSGVLSCIIYLQNYERSLEPDLKTRGEDVAKSFLKHILAEARKHSGKLFVIEGNGRILGFINGWIEEGPNEDDLLIRKWFYVSDLAVLPEYKRQHLGSQLITRMERYARSLKLSQIQIGVLAKNTGARSFYVNNGYRDYALVVFKNL
jgi:ribosomal protein S18 acetylase RimI-like enzyme